MSIEEEATKRAYAALVDISKIPREGERQKICMAIIHMAAGIIGMEVGGME